MKQTLDKTKPQSDICGKSSICAPEVHSTDPESNLSIMFRLAQSPHINPQDSVKTHCRTLTLNFVATARHFGPEQPLVEMYLACTCGSPRASYLSSMDLVKNMIGVRHITTVEMNLAKATLLIHQFQNSSCSGCTIQHCSQQ